MKSIKQILIYGDYEPAALWLSALMIVFGLFLLSPIRTFPTATAFVVLAKIVPEWAWGLWMFCLGTIRLIS